MRLLCWCLAVLLLAGCNVFRNTERERQRLHIDDHITAAHTRLDTSMRLVLETWAFPALSARRQYGTSGLHALKSELDSMGGILIGSRLTLEQNGVSETKTQSQHVQVDDESRSRTDDASWKGVVVWLGGITLVLAFLYILIKKYLP